MSLTYGEFGPERVARVLRAKQHELEIIVKVAVEAESEVEVSPVWLAADVALLCQVLADVLDRLDATSP